MRHAVLLALTLLSCAASTLHAQAEDAREGAGYAVRTPAPDPCEPGDPMPVFRPRASSDMPRVHAVTPGPMPNACRPGSDPLLAAVLDDPAEFRRRLLGSLPPGLPIEPLRVVVRVRTFPGGGIRRVDVRAPSEAPAFDRAVREALLRSSLGAPWTDRVPREGLPLSIGFSAGDLRVGGD